MLDASPLMIEKLRHHSFHITGMRVYDYRSNRDRWCERFVEKRRALLKYGKRELLIPEWRALGGFGFDIEGELYNLDTLKFFEVLIALESRLGARGVPQQHGAAPGLGDRRRVGRLSLPVQDALSECHVRHHRLSRVVPVLCDVPDDGVPGREGRGSGARSRSPTRLRTGAATISSSRRTSRWPNCSPSGWT